VSSDRRKRYDCSHHERQWLLLVSVLSLSLVDDWSSGSQLPEEEGMATSIATGRGEEDGQRRGLRQEGTHRAHRSTHTEPGCGNQFANGKSAVSLVNDRMRRTAQGVIEVTPRVAALLGFAKAGQARVRVELVK